MIHSLLAGVGEWLRGGRRQGFAPLRRGLSFGAPPRLEVLEDRCLLSSTTTVPSAADVPSLIAFTDYMFALQPKGNPSVIFVGDSISWEYAYGSGAAVWAAYMAPLGISSYGVIGQTTQSLLYEFSLGLLNNINPAVVVLDIGGNNLLQGDTPLATAEGIVADVAAIHQALPNAQILLLGVLPGMQNPSDPYRIAGTETDQLAAEMLSGISYVTYANIGSIFLEPDGTISSSVMPDYLHPSELGYLELTSVLLPLIGSALDPNTSFSFTLPAISLNLPQSSAPPSSVPMML